MWTVYFPISKMNELTLTNLKNIMLTKTSDSWRDSYSITFISNFIKQKKLYIFHRYIIKSMNKNMCDP